MDDRGSTPVIAHGNLQLTEATDVAVAVFLVTLSIIFPGVVTAGEYLPWQGMDFHEKGAIMTQKKLLDSQRIRKIEGSFSFIEHRFLRQGFYERLTHYELVLYLFLILAAARQGISYYSYDNICKRTELILEEYILASDGLINKNLIAFDGFFFHATDLVSIDNTRKGTRKGDRFILKYEVTATYYLFK